MPLLSGLALHNYRPSEDDKSASGARYRPALVSRGFVRSKARCIRAR